MSESRHDEHAADPPPGIGPARVVQAFRYSIEGLAATWRTEGAFRQEVLVAAVLIPLSAFLHVTLLEHALLVGSVLMVLMVELLNSSMEAAIDRISLDRHPLSKKAKDTGSAAVMLAVLLATIVWGAIVLPLVN
ncbi:MAG TPA: diacylglycerol kinase [Usitatibacter sp.]|nr:diacylglycerol kinase [Usitatibacter sp.]